MSYAYLRCEKRVKQSSAFSPPVSTGIACTTPLQTCHDWACEPENLSLRETGLIWQLACLKLPDRKVGVKLSE